MNNLLFFYILMGLIAAGVAIPMMGHPTDVLYSQWKMITAKFVVLLIVIAFWPIFLGMWIFAFLMRKH